MHKKNERVKGKEITPYMYRGRVLQKWHTSPYKNWS